MTLPDGEYGVWTLRWDYRLALQFAEFEYFTTTNLHNYIEEKMRLINLQRLKIRTENIIVWSKNKTFEERDFNKFMKVFVQEKVNLEEEKSWLPN